LRADCRCRALHGRERVAIERYARDSRIRGQRGEPDVVDVGNLELSAGEFPPGTSPDRSDGAHVGSAAVLDDDAGASSQLSRTRA